MVKGQGTRPFARMGLSKPAPLGPEHNPWFWNPGRQSIKLAPESFREKIKAISDQLEVTWNPIIERWQVWDRSYRIDHPLCQTWRLLFIHKDVDGSYLPLDERLFARLYVASADVNGNAVKYFNRVVEEMERDKAKREASELQDSIDRAMDVYDHSQIKVAMHGESSGSKFSTYHS